MGPAVFLILYDESLKAKLTRHANNSVDFSEYISFKVFLRAILLGD